MVSIHTPGVFGIIVVSMEDKFKLSVLQESPFTDKGSVVEIFTDLTVWMGIRRVIDQINANASA
jgi:hypothetical protein